MLGREDGQKKNNRKLDFRTSKKEKIEINYKYYLRIADRSFRSKKKISKSRVTQK
jgi:hypothetical protein